MKTISQKIFSLGMLAMFFLLSFISQAKTSEEMAEEQQKTTLYGEIGVGVLFVVALTLFIVWKTRHDKKERERHMKQMQKLAANKKRAA